MYKEIILSVIKTSLPLMIVLIILQYIFRKQSTCILIEFNVAYSIVRMMPLVNSMHTLGIKRDYNTYNMFSIFEYEYIADVSYP